MTRRHKDQPCGRPLRRSGPSQVSSTRPPRTTAPSSTRRRNQPLRRSRRPARSQAPVRTAEPDRRCQPVKGGRLRRATPLPLRPPTATIHPRNNQHRRHAWLQAPTAGTPDRRCPPVTGVHAQPSAPHHPAPCRPTQEAQKAQAPAAGPRCKGPAGAFCSVRGGRPARAFCSVRGLRAARGGRPFKARHHHPPHRTRSPGRTGRRSPGCGRSP